MAFAWQPLDTAPRDGTEVNLTWMDLGRPQDIYPMRWEPETGNALAQAGPGIWVMRSRVSDEVLCTWSESDPDGAPTHWQPRVLQ